MTRNIGRTEKIIRLSAGAAAAAAAILAPVPGMWKAVLGAAAADGLITGALGFSPFKRVLGIGR